MTSFAEGWKTKLIFLFALFFALLLVSRLYYLQIKKGELYEVLALGQQVYFKEIGGERGEIFFSNGTPLAKTKNKFIVYISPRKIPETDREETSKALSEILGEEQEELLGLFEKGKILKRELAKDPWQRLNSLHLKGVYLDKIFARFYPQEELASHVVGFVNTQGRGQYGIEGFYDDLLKGGEWLQEKPNSPFGYLISKKAAKPPPSLEKADLFLTLDYNLQYFAEKLLKKAKNDWNIESGQIIAVEPATGRILALAVFPGFNPNHYGREKKLGSFLNPILQKLFEPGSIFKPITFAAALQEGLITPETTYVDEGSVDLGGPPIYNFQRRVWGEQSMTDVLEESINTGAVFVEQKLGRELFLKYLEKFGFFEKVGIDLQGEVFSRNETLRNGYPRDLATASFGQGIELTPLQIVRAFGAIANGGRLVKPFIVEKIVKNNQEQVVGVKHQQTENVISQATANKLTSMLISVVEHGSGRRAKIPGYYIAGKTGTAQVALPGGGGYFEDKTIHSFIGFFPALSPQFLIFVKLDNPRGVGASAYTVAPLFRELAKYIIDSRQIPPSYE